MNQVQKRDQGLDLVSDIQNTKELARKLMETKHYQKIGEEGIFAICTVAKANDINQVDALNGEMYYVQGKVGMAAEAMNKYIRRCGHSITLKSLTDQGCTLIGKRKDTGDTAEISYTIDDMKSAGKNYEKNKKDMFFARAISRLKRVLFPDILTKVYEKSEVEEMGIDQEEMDQADRKGGDNLSPSNVKPLYMEKISTEEAKELQDLYDGCSDSAKIGFTSKLTKLGCKSFEELPKNEYFGFKTLLVERYKHNQQKAIEAEMAITGEVEVAE